MDYFEFNVISFFLRLIQILSLEKVFLLTSPFFQFYKYKRYYKEVKRKSTCYLALKIKYLIYQYCLALDKNCLLDYLNKNLLITLKRWF